jgi:hypothetical protein
MVGRMTTLESQSCPRSGTGSRLRGPRLATGLRGVRRGRMTLRPLLPVCLVLACAKGGDSDDGAADTDGDPTPGSATDPSADSSVDAGDGVDTTDGADTTDTADTGDSADTGDPPTCEATHTSPDAQLWTLPTPIADLDGEPYRQLGGANVCAVDGTVDFNYASIDLTGDGRLDLVVTSACDDGDVGSDFWLVYAGGADGFADEATLWSLPAPTANLDGEPFRLLGGADVCAADGTVDFNYSIADLTADGIPDLVVTSACDAGDVGSDFWLVHAGGEGGFADDASLWSLPTPTAALDGEPFRTFGGADVCAADGTVDFDYAVTDLTADGIVDLVVTSACDDGDVGSEFWLVYPGACE